MKNIYYVLILLFSICLADAVILENAAFESSKKTPLIGGNLKPELQPRWDQQDFTERIKETKLQVLRWPGAEAANFFDWTKGRMLPCYKWVGGKDLSTGCNELNRDYCVTNASNGHIGQTVCGVMTALDYHEDYELELGMKIGDNYPGIYTHNSTDYSSYHTTDHKVYENFTDNYASDYVKFVEDELESQTPLFTINMVNPEYIDMDIATWDSNCELNNPNIAIKNHWMTQLDTIKTIINNPDLNILASDVHIQLANEPFMVNHGWIRKIWPDTRDYVIDCIEIAEYIRNDSDLNQVKIGISGDVHGICEDRCNGGNWGVELRCDWNEVLWNTLAEFDAEDLFDAITIQQYWGMRNMQIDSRYNPGGNGFTWDPDVEWDPWDPIVPEWKNIDLSDIAINNATATDDDGDNFPYNFGYGPFHYPNAINERDFFIMSHFMYWMIAYNDMMFSDHQGDCITQTYFEPGYPVGSSLWEALDGTTAQGFASKEIWITESGYFLDGKPYQRPIRGTWFHSMSELYSVLSYMEKVPTLSMLITNNVIGKSGDYRLIDTYAYVDNNSGTRLCQDQTQIINGYNISACKEKCTDVFPQLSPKGVLFSFLSELTSENNYFGKIEFGDMVRENSINKYNANNISHEHTIKDVRGWYFSDIQVSNSNYNNYLFMNVSPSDYTIKFPGGNSYNYKIAVIDGYDYSDSTGQDLYYANLFNKNYFWVDPSSSYDAVNPNIDSGDVCGESNICGDGYDGYYRWEFSGPDPGMDTNLFKHTNNFRIIDGSININDNYELVIPKHSVVQVFTMIGDANLDGSQNSTDIVMIVNNILSSNAQYNPAYDVNNDGTIDVSDVVLLINIILN